MSTGGRSVKRLSFWGALCSKREQEDRIGESSGRANSPTS